MIPLLTGLVYLGGGAAVLSALSGLVYNVKTNPIDIGLLRLVEEANNRQFYITVAVLLLCFYVCYISLRGGSRTLIIIQDRNGQARNMIENITEFRGQRLQIPYEQHINRMIEEPHRNARGRLNSEAVYKQQMNKAIRQSLEEQDRKLVEQLQLKELRKSTRHNFGEQRHGDIHQRRKPSKASKNELEYETYFHTDDTDGGLRKRKRSDSCKKHNDLTTDYMYEFNGFKEGKFPVYKGARYVDDFTYQDHAAENSCEAEDETNARQEKRTSICDDDENLDLRELEKLHFAIALSRSLEDPKGKKKKASANEGQQTSDS